MIDIEDFIKANELRRKINSVPLKDLKITYKGEAIPLHEKCVEDWAITGMNNWDFLCCYLPDFLKEVVNGTKF